MTLSLSTLAPELAELPQWVLWRAERRNGKLTKVPYQTSGALAKSTDPATWTTAEAACKAVNNGGGYSGVGFVVTADDDFVGVDLDHALDDSGTCKPWATQILTRFDSRAEWTPSGDGLRIWCRGEWRSKRSKTRMDPDGGALEVYDRGRYFTVTGDLVPDFPTEIHFRQDALDWLRDSFLQPPPDAPEAPRTEPAAPAEPDDLALLEHAYRAKNGDQIRRLMEGDTSDYGQDESAADLALCCHLAFWCQGDPGRIDRIFRTSGLYRPKWERASYRERTLKKAVDGLKDVYDPGPAATVSQTAGRAGNAPPGLPKADPPEPAPGSPGHTIAHGWQSARAFLLRASEAPMWLIPHLLPDAGTIMFHGRPRSMKSWVALDLALAAALGAAPWGCDRFRPGRPLRVAVLCEEDAAGLLARRLDWLIRGRMVTDPPDTLMIAARLGLILEVPSDQARLTSAVNDFGAELVMIDTARAVAPGVDQGPAEGSRLVRYLRNGVLRQGRGLIVVHHDTKPGRDGVDTRVRAEQASGGALLAAVESPIGCSRVDDRTTLLHPDRFKVGDTPGKLEVKFQTATTEGEFRDWVRLEAQHSDEDQPTLDAANAILALLQDGEARTTRAIVGDLGRRYETVLAALKHLAKIGQLEKIEGAHGAIRYRRAM